ncbi:hypothetical protein GTV32_22040 [Gordonia sp. SID5947]|uniref:hypothetical protein n=1 Tax=Gordonia sp. SID5947 TaxID=2690315 RepID=UPI00136BC536|nr:hypothetical protein [Gordonia sp. SID5947]MYR08827.1 hypothetical protein [Gordonia sp. SID5947]
MTSQDHIVRDRPGPDPDIGTARSGDIESDVAQALSSARSRSGAISVVTTPQGLPMSVRLDQSALSKESATLAGEILRLCQQSATAAGIRLREHLVASGVARDVVDAMKLPRPDDLARAEQLDDRGDDVGVSWLRPV